MKFPVERNPPSPTRHIHNLNKRLEYLEQKISSNQNTSRTLDWLKSERLALRWAIEVLSAQFIYNEE